MGKLTDFVMAKKIKELSGEERIKIIRKENERKMAEIREKVRKREQDKERESWFRRTNGQNNLFSCRRYIRRLN